MDKKILKAAVGALRKELRAHHGKSFAPAEKKDEGSPAEEADESPAEEAAEKEAAAPPKRR